MKYFLALTFLVVTFYSCSKNDDNNPVNNEIIARGFIRGDINSINWYSNKITTNKNDNTRILKGTQDITNDPKFTASILELRLGVNQTGTFGIGENEPGYQYSVKAYYTLVSRSGTEDEYFKAYYEKTSLLKINRISSTNLDATFNFIARTDDSTKTIVFSAGVIQIDY